MSRASGAGTANRPRPGRLFIGTSGWQYRHWYGPFYPEKPRPRDLLAFYAERFDTVEVNGTFYRLASAAACRRWREVTGPTFTFACKGSRYLTHMRRLKETGQGIERFFAPLRELEGKLGPIVFQLPERSAPDLDRLTAFMAGLPQPHRYAFEFRNADWFRDDVLERLAEHAAALCLYDFEGRQAPLRITADFVYIRLHGPGAKYSGKYDEAALATWAERLSGWRERGLDTYCYFDNDAYGYSVSNVMQLKAMLGCRGNRRGNIKHVPGLRSLIQPFQVFLLCSRAGATTEGMHSFRDQLASSIGLAVARSRDLLRRILNEHVTDEPGSSWRAG